MKLLLCVFILVFFSCSTINYQKVLENEVNYYGVTPKDTILDIGYNWNVVAPLVASQVDSLHFYFIETPSHKPNVEGFLSSSVRINQQYGRNNYTTAGPAMEKADNNILLPSGSIDKIIFRNYLWLYSREDVLSELKRLLKPSGTLIIIQEDRKITKKQYKNQPLPIKNEVISYFEIHGFVNTKSINEVPSPIYKNHQQFQLHFRKKV